LEILKNVENIEIFPYANFSIKYKNSLNFPRFSRILSLTETFKEFLKVFGNFEKCRKY
jgi:hypothetical protein